MEGNNGIRKVVIKEIEGIFESDISVTFTDSSPVGDFGVKLLVMNFIVAKSKEKYTVFLLHTEYEVIGDKCLTRDNIASGIRLRGEGIQSPQLKAIRQAFLNWVSLARDNITEIMRSLELEADLVAIDSSAKDILRIVLYDKKTGDMNSYLLSLYNPKKSIELYIGGKSNQGDLQIIRRCLNELDRWGRSTVRYK